MPRPKRDIYELYVRLSDGAVADLDRRAEALGLSASALVEQILDRYLDRTMDGQLPLHLFAYPHEMKLRKFTLNAALGQRVERVRTQTGFGQQEIGRAAITEFLHVL